MSSAYIATRLENHRQHTEVRDALAEICVSCTYDWTTHGPVYRDGVKRIREVSLAELKGVADSDFVVVILPGGRGTHTELGAALALGKPVLLLCLTDETRKMAMEAVTETCAFYHHPLCIPVFGIHHLLNYARELSKQ